MVQYSTVLPVQYCVGYKEFAVPVAALGHCSIEDEIYDRGT